MSIEDTILRSAIAEAEQVIAELERANALSAAAAWWESKTVLQRFLDRPHCIDVTQTANDERGSALEGASS